MIPLKLFITGLYSYRETQEIDFTRLTEATIFGIFGKVGSGKSSILEAITFALYGDIERLNNRENRNYNMMNLGSDSLHIDFTCIAGKEGKTYRFTVKGKRNSKRFDEVDTFERKSYEWITELSDWSPIKAEDAAERIIGLNYENFKRTTIIPQGRFQEFIDLPLSKRTQMMQEIFPLKKYELSAKVKILKEANERLLDRLEWQLTQIGQTTPEMLEQVENELKNTQLIIKFSHQELTEKIADEKQLEILRKLFENLTNTVDKVKELEKQAETFNEQAERLKKYQVCLINFKPLFDTKRTRTIDWQRDTTTFNEKSQQYKVVQNKVAEESEKLQTLTPLYQNREKLKQQADELGWLLKIKEGQLNQADLLEKQRRGKAAVEMQQATLLTLKQQKESIEQQLQQLKNERIDVERLSQIAVWFAEKERLNKEKYAITEAGKNFKEKLQELIKQKKEVTDQEISSGYLSDGQKEDQITAIQTILAAGKKALVEKIDKLQEDILHLKTRQALQGFADALKNDEPCPLCGSVHHPQILSSAENFSAKMQAIEQQQKKWKDEAESLEKANSRLTLIELNSQFFEEQRQELLKQYADNQQLIEKHEESFIWQEFSPTDAEAVKNAFETAKKQGQNLTILEENNRKKEVEIVQAQRHLDEKVMPALRDLEGKIDLKKAEIQLFEQQIKQLKVSDFAEKTTDFLRASLIQLTTQYEQITKDFEQLTQNIQLHRDKQNVLLGEISSLEKNIGQHEVTLKEISETIDNQLVTWNFSAENEVQLVLAWGLSTETEEKAINEFRLALNTAGNQLEELQENTKGLRYEAKIHQKLQVAIAELSQKINELRSKEGGLTNQVEKLRKDLSDQKDLLKEKEKLLIRSKDIDTLTKLFKGSGFVSYVSSMHLRNLCNQANERFHKMTRQQLQLEIYEPRPAEYDFQVRDLLNEGRTRAVKTLSGGQKFQAALSLALALADNIHIQNQSKHNFFFLDEGFGSLDKDSLQIVFETLKSLRKENRIVGVISHVEDLQQEIDTYLQIKFEDNSSKVYTSW